MATIYSISEQILLRISKGYPDNASPVQIEDIKLAVNQKINQLLRAQYYGGTLPSGDTIPDGLMMAFYENIPVQSIGERSYAIIPVIPVSLPRNMGVFEVTPGYGQGSTNPEYLSTEGGTDITSEKGQKFEV